MAETDAHSKLEALYPGTLYTPDVEEIWGDANALLNRMTYLKGVIGGLAMSLSPQVGLVPSWQAKAIESHVSDQYYAAHERRQALVSVARTLDERNDRS